MKKVLLFLIIVTGLVSCQSKVVSKKTIKCQEDVKVGSFIEVDGESYKVVDEIMLREMIRNNNDVTYVCTSKITDMAGMCSGSSGNSTFNQPIGNWDVSNVTNMGSMFFGNSTFNQPIGKWDVSSVTNMGYMFYAATAFNQPIGAWDVSNVTDMGAMFTGPGIPKIGEEAATAILVNSFNQDISSWDVSNVTDMYGMFDHSDFNGDLSKWVNKPTSIKEERLMRVKNNSKNDCTTEDKDRITRKMEQQDHYVTDIIIPYDRVYVVYYISGSTGNTLEKKFDFSNSPCN
tara:strand:- start:398 stop:1261 length:864 start_codon:yes stop_codon:yes gene_type:complete